MYCKFHFLFPNREFLVQASITSEVSLRNLLSLAACRNSLVPSSQKLRYSPDRSVVTYVGFRIIWYISVLCIGFRVAVALILCQFIYLYLTGQYCNNFVIPQSCLSVSLVFSSCLLTLTFMFCPQDLPCQVCHGSMSVCFHALCLLLSLSILSQLCLGVLSPLPVPMFFLCFVLVFLPVVFSRVCLSLSQCQACVSLSESCCACYFLFYFVSPSSHVPCFSFASAIVMCNKSPDFKGESLQFSTAVFILYFLTFLMSGRQCELLLCLQQQKQAPQYQVYSKTIAFLLICQLFFTSVNEQGLFIQSVFFSFFFSRFFMHIFETH